MALDAITRVKQVRSVHIQEFTYDVLFGARIRDQTLLQYLRRLNDRWDSTIYGSRHFLINRRTCGVSGLRQGNATLPLILATAVLVRGFTDLIGLKEEELGYAFIGVDLGR
jgi:hypothetical protein